METLPALVQRQFARPRGLLGAVAGRVMATRPTNVERSRWTVDLLELRGDEHVLEVGHGPGIGLAVAAAAVPCGQVAGIEHSLRMLRSAARRNAALVEEGRLTLLLGDAQRPPAWIGRFDAVFACNVWAHWTEPSTALAGLASRLTAGGCLAVTHMPPGRDRDPAEARRAGREIAGQFAAVGFDPVSVVEGTPGGAPAVCVLGRAR